MGNKILQKLSGSDPIKGVLDENYDLVDEIPEEKWAVSLHSDYWDGEHFDIDGWREEFSACMNGLKINPKRNPASGIGNIIGYHFVNENLLRQAFTRRAFQIEYGLSGCSEELEFLGDSVLSIVVTKELMDLYAKCRTSDTGAPFHAELDEGQFTKLKSRFVNKDHLAKRCLDLRLDTFILFGTGEEKTYSALEDTVEAIIGAVAIDCGWDMDILSRVVDKLVEIQIFDPVTILKKSSYDMVNAWHQKHFGCMPEYDVYKNPNKKTWVDRVYYCKVKFQTGSGTEEILYDGDTRSQARELAADCVYDYLLEHGLWIDLKDANVVPDPDRGINQLQEMKQQGYIGEAEYVFNELERGGWQCDVWVSDIHAIGKGSNKSKAKKRAAYEAVVHLLKAAGCCKEEWWDAMIESSVIDPMKEEVAKELLGCGVKYSTLVSVLEQVEEGKVITEKVLVDWIGKKLGMENLQINYREVPNIPSRKEDAPWHRFLTSTGLVNGWYKDKLIAEGHEVVETKTTNWRVLDYRETMVDVETLVLPEDPIGPCGHFIENVRDDLKAALMAQAEKFKDK